MPLDDVSVPQPPRPAFGPTSRPTWRGRLLHEVGSRLPPWLLSTRGPRSRREVALTFDDGPDDLTATYLALLAELGVVATFFVIGENAARRPRDVEAMVAAGHEVAGHGFTHKPFPTLGRRVLRDELERTHGLLPSPPGRRFVRPPRGAISPRSLALTAAFGFSTVHWSVDSDDCRTQSAEEIAAKLSPVRVRPGENILMHEGQAWTLKALRRFVPPLKEAGFTFVPVSRFLGGT